MAKRSLAEQLDHAVQALLDHPKLDHQAAEASHADADISALLQIAAELRNLPRQEFKARLKSDLQASGSARQPESRPTASPYLTLSDAAAGIEFYKRAFGAVENMRLTGPDGKIMHAEIQIGNAPILLADEYPQFGAISPQTLGGSPVKLQLNVDDVDSFAAQAVAAGAKLIRPVENHFYGHRAGQLADPFGYVWMVSTRIEALSTQQIQQRFGTFLQQHIGARAKFEMRPGFRAMTPYLIARNVPGVIEFMQKAFHAEETLRSGPGSEGGMHCEVRIGDTMLMVGGGGGTGYRWKGEPRPGAFHIYVSDCDAVYQRALAAGGVAVHAPVDQPYGERSATVRDQAGNLWYIATYDGEDYRWPGAPTVQLFLHPLRAEPLMNFLKNAFGATELGRSVSPEGVIHHASLKIGDALFELGEAHDPEQPVRGTFFLYVPDVDATYRRALAAGAISVSEPSDQPYGDRMGTVHDVFGNEWFLATPKSAT